MDHLGAAVPANDLATACFVPGERATMGAGDRSNEVRVALYSHDTMGIGHLRRNLLIAEALAAGSSRADILLIAGAREASAFGLPRGVDCLTLPSLRKDENGKYDSLRLHLKLDDLIELRGRTIETALDHFRPDVFIVDKVPRGVQGELDRALCRLRDQGRTALVLGLRDILDDPATVEREWRSTASEEAVRDFYDAIWVYGDPAVYDPVVEYSFSKTAAAKVRYTGYPDQRKRSRYASEGAGDPIEHLLSAQGELILCMVGGGQDGDQLAEAFSQVEFAPGTFGVLVTGPFMPADVSRRLKLRAASNPRLHLLTFVTDSDSLMRRADRVIAMGGYNTVCEILAFEKVALVVPRVKPRLEQLIRAERMRELGLLDLILPDALTPQSIASWIAEPRLPPPVRDLIDMNALARLPSLLGELLPVSPIHFSPTI